MTGRERVKRTMHFLPVDCVPVQFYYAPVGYYEHGEKLNDLYATLEGDFAPFKRMPLPKPAAADLDHEGNYHAFHRDEWGTCWEYRIFGVTGIPADYPLADLDKLDNYTFPAVPSLTGPHFDAACRQIALHQEKYYYLHPAGSLFERLIALRPEADVLCDMALGEPRINLLADRIIEHQAHQIQFAIAAGADGIAFGDDYGTEQDLIMSPQLWRHFIKPRLRLLFEPAVRAGLDIHFHSCGKISRILEDLQEIGVSSIWPQLPAYDLTSLAAICRSLGLAVAVHTDRAQTMTHGSPQDVRKLVLREFETFRMADGGAWFYIEADNGFSFENIVSLIDTIRELRRGLPSC